MLGAVHVTDQSALVINAMIASEALTTDMALVLEH
jgi:hypothetical protein